MVWRYSAGVRSPSAWWGRSWLKPWAKASTEGSKPFAEGWLDEDAEYSGRPMDVAPMRDGSLLVSDDLAGAVYRITYEGK